MSLRWLFPLFSLIGCAASPQGGRINAGTAVCSADACQLSLSMKLEDLEGQPVQTGLSPAQFSFHGVELEGEGSYEVDDALPVDLEAEELGGKLLVPLVVDQSGSMEDNDPDNLRLAAAESTAEALLAGAPARVALFSFPRTQYLGEFSDSDLHVDYTDDSEALTAAVESLAGAEGGGTPLYDSLLEVVEHQSAAQEEEEDRVVIVLTDGRDSDSSHRMADVVALAEEEEVRIYVAGLGENVDFEELAALAAGTRGAFVPASDPERLEQTLTGLADAVYGNVTLDAEILLSEDSDPLEVGLYRFQGSLDYRSQFTMELDLEVYVGAIEETP
ncbi:MAG TPA: VWA domain-containing protein [Myxococcota bacterium]|nr:VWA domain-containing protein [Myxococcota bacterium]